MIKFLVSFLFLCSTTCFAQTPEQTAIQQQIDAVSATGGGIVVLPEGETELIRLAQGGSGCLLLASNVTLEGHPNGSTLKLGDNQVNSTRLLMVEDDTNVVIRNMLLDGNKENQTGEGDHRAGIFALSCSDLLIENITAQNFTGDGIQIYTDVNGLEIKDFLIQDTDRDGIALTGFGSDILIYDGTFINVAVQSIDFEPNQSTWFYDDVVMYDLDVQGVLGKGYAFVIAQVRNGLFYNLTITGTLQIIYSEDIRVLDSTVKDGSQGAIFFRRWSKNVLISNCDLSSPAISSWPPIRIIAHPNEHVSDLKIINNKLTSHSTRSVHWQGGYRVTIAFNDIHHNGSGSVFYVRSTEDMFDSNILSNVVHAPATTTFVSLRGYQIFSFNRITILGNQSLGPVVNVNAILNWYYSDQ
jgi:hypothetical protein